MSIADEANYVSRRDAPYQRVQVAKNATTGQTNARPFTTWITPGFPAQASVPSTPIAPDRTTTGAIGQLNTTGTQRVLQALLTLRGLDLYGGMLTLVDRLSHQGGLSGIVTGDQTTNLPTAALTRKTSGVGVMCGLEFYSNIGATGTTATVSYTNSAGSSGLTSQPVTIGGTGFNNSARIIFVPPAGMDVGFRAVASVNLAASTLAAGNFGVTLFYPIVSIPHMARDVMRTGEFGALYGLGTWFPSINNNACLSFVVHNTNTSSGTTLVQLAFAED